MNYTRTDIVRMLDGVRVGNNQWKAHCPCHDDKKESLSISEGKDGKVLLYCHSGCDSKDIFRYLCEGYEPLHNTSKSKDDKSTSFDFKNVAETYNYGDGTRKLRDNNKNFVWQHLESNNWISGRGNIPKTLFIKGKESETIYLVEGEKDVLNLSRLGLYVATAPDGAGNGKWLPQYNKKLKHKKVRIIADNDNVGISYAKEIAESVKVVAKEVKLFDLTQVWKDIPEHADISDLLQRFGKDKTLSALDYLEKNTEPISTNKGSERKTIVIQSNKKVIDDIVSRVLKELEPERNTEYRQSDIGNGKLFAEVFKDTARYSTERKRWFVYDGMRWKVDDDDATVSQLCKKLADGLIVYALSIPDERTRLDYQKFVNKWQSRNTRITILKDAQSENPVRIDEFDIDREIINLKNGTYNLKTKEFKEHHPGDLLSKVANVYYDKDAKCERWDKFIREVTSNDEEKAKYLQKALGYALSGSTKEECFFILYGATSRNGKGTLTETIRNLLGDYSRTTSPESISQKDKSDGSKPSEDIARLSGCRFVNISEPDKKMVLSSALIKTLTGGDSIVARHLNEGSFEFIPQFKIFINTNHLPTVTDSTVFNSDRIKVIPFNKHFDESERDKDLKQFFSRKENLSGILNWLIDGYEMYMQEGLKNPSAIIEATEDYKKDSDKIYRFITDEMEQGSEYEDKVSNIYSRYQSWCGKYGFIAPSIKSFSQDLEVHIHINKNKRPRMGGNPTSLVLGYRIKQ